MAQALEDRAGANAGAEESIMSPGRVLILVAVVLLAAQPSTGYAQFGDGSPLNWQSYGSNGFYGGLYGDYYGGVPGMGYFPGNMSMVISQTQQNHEQIADLLDQLRRMQGTQVQITTPYHSLNDSYYERIGVDFDFSFKPGRGVVGLDAHGNPTSDGRIHFNQGSFDSALPQFGGHDASTDAMFGIGGLGKKFSPSLRFALGQGSNRSHVMQAPTVVMHDGQTGFVSDTSMRPFVTSVIPVVGAGLPMMRPSPPISPVKQALARMEAEKKLARQRQPRAERDVPREQVRVDPFGDPVMPRQDDGALLLGQDRPAPADDDEPLVLKGPPGSGEATPAGGASGAGDNRPQQAKADAARKQEVRSHIQKARRYEETGKLGIAKIYYQQAAARADGELKKELLRKIQSLGN